MAADETEGVPRYAEADGELDVEGHLAADLTRAREDRAVGGEANVGDFEVVGKGDRGAGAACARGAEA